MSSSFIAPRAFEPESARKTLADWVSRTAAEALAAPNDTARVVRVELPIETMPPLAWLRVQPDGPKMYWSDRSGAFESAGFGAADEVAGDGAVPWAEVLAPMEARLAGAHPHVRYFGGFRFQGAKARPGSPWSPMGAYRFVLPRVELLKAGGQAYLACNLVAGCDVDAGEALDALDSICFPEDGPEPSFPRPESRRDRPDRAAWTEMIGRALELFRTGDLEKVVLARESEFRFRRPPDALALVERLTTRAARAYCFCFQPQPGLAFLGATPERLYARRGRLVESEAVAGTRRRGDSPEADEALGRDLLASDKDMREHTFVVEALARGFAALCSVVKGHDETVLLPLSECQHLYRRIEGILAGPPSDAALLEVLHPTPAVGGHPRAAALDWIERLEPFDRGWYAGPVGWVGAEAAEFAVALRCGLVHDACFSVYSGAGIVSGSDADSEWDEIESKLGSVAGALDVHDR